MVISKISVAAIIVLVASAAFFVVRLVPYVNRPTPGFLVAYSAGRMLADGREMRLLYDSKSFAEIAPALAGVPNGDIYTINTPILPILFLPFSHLPVQTAKVLWELFSLGCVAISLRLLFDHFGFGTLEKIALTACVFGFAPLYLNFVWGQLYGFILILHVLLLRFWTRNSLPAAGFVLACLLLLKGYGLPFILLALARRDIRLLAWTGGIAALMVASSMVLVGAATWLAYLKALVELVGSLPASATFQQTLGSLFSWCFVRDGWNEHPMAELPGLVRPLLLLSLIAGAVFLWRMGRNRSRTGFDMAYSAAILLSLVTAPLLFDYHYTIALIPLFACFAHVQGIGGKAVGVSLAAALLLLLPKIPYYEDVFQKHWFGILAFPRVYGSLILFWICDKVSSVDSSRSNSPRNSALELAAA